MDLLLKQRLIVLASSFILLFFFFILINRKRIFSKLYAFFHINKHDNPFYSNLIKDTTETSNVNRSNNLLEDQINVYKAQVESLKLHNHKLQEYNNVSEKIHKDKVQLILNHHDKTLKELNDKIAYLILTNNNLLDENNDYKSQVEILQLFKDNSAQNNHQTIDILSTKNKKEILELNITQLKLPSTIKNSLITHGITTIKILIKKNEFQLKKLPNIGDKSIDIIKSELIKYKLYLHHAPFISVKHKSLPLPNETIIYQYNYEGKLINTFSSIKEASIKLKIDKINIRGHIKRQSFNRNGLFYLQLTPHFVFPKKIINRNPLYMKTDS